MFKKLVTHVRIEQQWFLLDNNLNSQKYHWSLGDYRVCKRWIDFITRLCFKFLGRYEE